MNEDNFIDIAYEDRYATPFEEYVDAYDATFGPDDAYGPDCGCEGDECDGSCVEERVDVDPDEYWSDRD